MATFNLVLDKRVRLKNNQFNLSIRLIHGKNQQYFRLSKMTEDQYKEIFKKNNLAQKHVEFRENCYQQLTKVEKILSSMKNYDPKELKRRFEQEEDSCEKNSAEEESHLLGDWFDKYILASPKLKFRTKKHFQYSKNVFIRDNPTIKITEVTKEFLENFESARIQKGDAIPSINSNFRDLRAVINFFRREVRNLPLDYQYPFGQGKFILGNFYPKKLVMSNDEIKKVIELKDFNNQEEEYARDIWELLYRFNGINFADLLRLRWKDRKGNYFIFFRKKTENTRKSNKQEIIVPVNEKIQCLLDRVGDSSSEFVLGLLKEGYTEAFFDYINRKKKTIINKNLGEVSQRLSLSVPLKLKTARDTYATVLKRKGRSRDEISEMLNHANPIVTGHYLASLDMEKTVEINECLI